MHSVIRAIELEKLQSMQAAYKQEISLLKKEIESLKDKLYIKIFLSLIRVLRVLRAGYRRGIAILEYECRNCC